MHSVPITQVFAEPVSINMYIGVCFDPNFIDAKYEKSCPSSSIAIAFTMSGLVAVTTEKVLARFDCQRQYRAIRITRQCFTYRRSEFLDVQGHGSRSLDLRIFRRDWKKPLRLCIIIAWFSRMNGVECMNRG